MNTKLLRSTSAALVLLAFGSAHAATTPDPGDYTALPAGTDLALVYAQRVTGDKVYADGSQTHIPGGLGMSANIGVFRYVHFAKWAGYTIDPQIVVPVATQNVDLTHVRSSGVGDVTFGGTLWTIADLPGGEHLGYSIFLTAPTGVDKDKGFAISDNRWAADLQVGYIKRFAPKWSVDLIGQTEVYQDRRDTGSKKDPLVRGIVHLRHHLSDATHLGVSLRYAAGTKETLGSSTVAGRKSDTNLTLTWASFLTKQVQLQLQYSDDLKVQNGPRLQTLGLRALYVF
nr:transporter [uncultured Albidiferax sp.]